MAEPKEDAPTIDLEAYRDLLAALECLAEDLPLPMGIDRWDLLDLARRVVVRR